MTPIAEIADYPALIRALRERAQALHIAIGGASVAEVAGLPAAYLAKLLRPNSDRRLGMISLGPVLGVMGVKLLMVECPDAMKAVKGRIEPAMMQRARVRTFTHSVSLPHLQRIGRLGGAACLAAVSTQKLVDRARLGGLARAAKLTPEQRKASARKAAKARHMKRTREASSEGV